MELGDAVDGEDSGPVAELAAEEVGGAVEVSLARGAPSVQAPRSSPITSADASQADLRTHPPTPQALHSFG
ncbi:hypothetical protein ACOKSZ_11215 [Propionibacteriaceae bacterium Y1685]